jgi:hypothetical protein
MKTKKKGKAKKGDAAEDSNGSLKRKEYEKELEKLQGRLCTLQEWVKHSGQRVIIVFEGRDAAGKGGTIKALTERVSPRVFRVVALPAPSDREKTQMYMQRYMAHFPAAGEIVIFDRSWYNRAGVERVMGFCTDKQYESFIERCPEVGEVPGDAAASSSSSSGWRSATRSRSAASRRASTTRCGNGSSARWTCPRASAGSTTRARAIRCWKRPTRSTRPGPSCAPTTSGARA